MSNEAECVAVSTLPSGGRVDQSTAVRLNPSYSNCEGRAYREKLGTGFSSGLYANKDFEQQDWLVLLCVQTVSVCNRPPYSL